MTPEEFQQLYMPYAQAVSQRTGLDPRLVLAQSALETGYGRSAPNNNFFGIKSHGQSGGSNLMTQEFENGQMVSRPQSFRGYESPAQSFEGYADFIEQNPRYRDVLQQGDLAGQISAMGRSGYATDPNYASKLANIAQRFGGDVDMTQFSTSSAPDTPQAVGRDTRSALGLLQNEGSQMTQDEPRGLLEMFGIQKRDPNAQGETALPFYQRQTFGDALARMAPALGRMGVMGLEGPAQAALDARNQRQGQEKQMNRTIEWLRSQPNGEQFVKLAEAMGPQAALQAWQKSQQGPDQTSAMQNYQFLISQGVPPNKAMERAFSGGTNIQIGPDGTPQAQIGTVPPGYQAVPDGNGGYAMAPIPGGPAAAQIAADAAAEAARSETAGTNEAIKESVVGGSIDKLTDMIDKGGIFDMPEAGIVGNALGALGVNQEAVDFKNELTSVQANIAFDRLQQMREASKTGGALGAVSERELDLLMNAYGNINQSSSPQLLRENLMTIKQIMTKIENDPVASAAYYGNAGGAPAAGGGDGFTVTGRID